ncbi:MAG: hypothetical protein M3Q75_12755 [Gemmatimonadota bacterium]|nr:hypothetical protein [Gemmatimonadota bacterium]
MRTGLALTVARAQVTFIIDIPDRPHHFVDNRGGEYYGGFVDDKYGWPVEFPAHANVEFLDETEPCSPSPSR